MALRDTPRNLGEFQHADTGVWFTFEGRIHDKWTVSHGFIHEIHMSNGTTRSAKVMKTVVYICVDEDEYGQPVVEKWNIKKCCFYER